MKRNALMRRGFAVLVAMAATGTVFAGAPVSAADVECRYSLHPGPAPAPVLYPNLFQQVPPVSPPAPFYADFATVKPGWSILAIRSVPGTDHSVGLVDCDWGRRSLSQLPGIPVDFIGIDGNRPVVGRRMSSAIAPVKVAAGFGIEYSAGGEALAPGGVQTLAMRGTPALVRDVYVGSGQSAVIVLRVVSGDADLFVLDSSTSDSGMRSRSQAVVRSEAPGLAEERVTISVPIGVAGRTFGVVVTSNTHLTDAYLHRF